MFHTHQPLDPLDSAQYYVGHPSRLKCKNEDPDVHGFAPMASCSHRIMTEPCLNRGWTRWVRRSGVVHEAWRHTPSRAKISCRPCSCGRDRADILRGHSFRMTDTSPLRISLGLPKGSGLITGNSVLGIGLSRVWCRRRMVVYRT